ncbi:hypothetical protein ABMA46_01760 [Mesorhizobium sp. CN5-321]|uniref:hypothetical protein n=1 Tax=Mesorhizobium hunchu TaxID=3157708 RepID=UPI0032B81D00
MSEPFGYAVDRALRQTFDRGDFTAIVDGPAAFDRIGRAHTGKLPVCHAFATGFFVPVSAGRLLFWTCRKPVMPLAPAGSCT